MFRKVLVIMAVILLSIARTAPTGTDVIPFSCFICSLLMVLQESFPPLIMCAWEHPECEGHGECIDLRMDLGLNMSSSRLSHSFTLKRALIGPEQLDISITDNPSTWYPLKNDGLSDNPSCTDFVISYDTFEAGCHNSPPFTCYRLWMNPGLPARQLLNATGDIESDKIFFHAERSTRMKISFHENIQS